MKATKKTSSIPRRLGAISLAVTVLWVVFATAGSRTLQGALDALSQRSALPLALLRAQLGDERDADNWLTAATAMVISQSPLLLSSREAILSLRSRDDGDDQSREPPDTTQPIRETPVEPEELEEGAAGAGASATSSTRVPNLPQPGQRPNHCGLCAPHSEQI